MNKDTRINYSTSNHPVSSFESDRRRFLGDNEYGTWANPLSLQQEELSNYEALRGDNIAAPLHHLGVIRPSETTRLITQLGQDEGVQKALPSIRHYRDTEHVERALWEQSPLQPVKVEAGSAVAISVTTVFSANG